MRCAGNDMGYLTLHNRTFSLPLCALHQPAFHLDSKNYKIGIIGLGYVGLPLACLFATRHEVVGYDIDRDRVEQLCKGIDRTGEAGDEALRNAIAHGMRCTTAIGDLRCCNVYVVTVPTPIDGNRQPDLAPLIAASRSIGQVISRGDLVVYESTVYPGVTEEICVPEIERVSGLRLNVDFCAGYSPERINPGDKVHRVENIRKITSGSTPAAADEIDAIYNSVLKNGTHKAPSIKVAEAAKIIENTQRDVNIALMNELAKIFNAMGIDTCDVLAAARTKWNFIDIRPGLVGGHCISVDPYYLIQRAKLSGVLPRVMTEARRINDSMGDYVANQAIRLMNLHDVRVKDAAVLLLGFAFKENCPDTRNTKVADIYHTFSQYTGRITIYDPWVDAAVVKASFGIDIATDDIEECQARFDCIVLCTAHDIFKTMDLHRLLAKGGVIYDVKGVLPEGMYDKRL